MHSVKRTIACLFCAAVLGTPWTVPAVRAAQTLHDDAYETVAKTSEALKCYSTQGMAVSDAYLYSAQIGDDDARAVIHRVDRHTGERVLMQDARTDLSYFTELGHANDLDLAEINGEEYLFVLSGAKVISFRIADNVLHPHAEYALKRNDKKFSPGSMAIGDVTSDRITFLFKQKKTVSSGIISTAATGGNIHVTVRCTLDLSQVPLDGESRDFSAFTNQGMGYAAGYLFVPITGHEEPETKSHSLILGFDMRRARDGNTLQPEEELIFYIVSKEYAGLFEIEDCDIAPDGRLYFNTNGRISSTKTKHDGVFVLRDFVLEDALICTLQYDGNGGTGTMPSAVVPANTAITPAVNAFTREGYLFAGWKAYSTRLARETDISDTVAAGDTVILSAQWKPITSTLQYDGSGGTGHMDPQTVIAGTVTLQPNAFTAPDKLFAGWRADAEAGGQYFDDGAEITGLYTEDGGTVTLTAQWQQCGDANGDGRLNLADAAAICLHVFGWRLSPAQPQYIDVNADGTVSIADAWCLFTYAAGFIPALPVCQ